VRYARSGRSQGLSLIEPLLGILGPGPSVMELYDPDAALIAQPGSVAQGSEQVRAALQSFLAVKASITLDTKLVVTVGTGPDGNPVTLGATTAEVARRQADGTWRYVIDNAWGDQAVAG
jgi:ketosteroid isomerase-like protein